MATARPSSPLGDALEAFGWAFLGCIALVIVLLLAPVDADGETDRFGQAVFVAVPTALALLWGLLCLLRWLGGILVALFESRRVFRKEAMQTPNGIPAVREDLADIFLSVNPLRGHTRAEVEAALAAVGPRAGRSAYEYAHAVNAAIDAELAKRGQP